MKKNMATEMSQKLSQLSTVKSTQVVVFDEKGGTNWESIERIDEKPDDDLYGVYFYAFDSLIPHNVIEIISKYETGGIYTHPDIGVVCP